MNNSRNSSSSKWIENLTTFTSTCLLLFAEFHLQQGYFTMCYDLIHLFHYYEDTHRYVFTESCHPLISWCYEKAHLLRVSLFVAMSRTEYIRHFNWKSTDKQLKKPLNMMVKEDNFSVPLKITNNNTQHVDMYNTDCIRSASTHMAAMFI